MTTCTSSCSAINYCFIAKLLVAIPAIPIFGVLLAQLSQDPDWQITLAAYAGALAVWLSQKIDQIPYLQQPFKPFKSK